MKRSTVRILIELPHRIYRRLQETAVIKHRPVEKPIMDRIERALQEAEAHRPKRRLAPDPAPIKPAGRRITIADDVYELTEFP